MDVQALSASSGDHYKGPVTIPQRKTGARWRARETHGVMPNPRQVASGGKRSPSSKSALHEGFSTFVCGLGNGKSRGREKG